MPTSPARNPLRVLIAGGGVAALEALIALRDLAGDRVAVTLLAPEESFTYRPLATARPFSLGHPTQHRLATIARDFGAELVQDRVVEVDAERRLVRAESGAEHAYDALVIAVGARTVPVPHAITFGEDPTDEMLHGLVADLEEGYVRGIAFVAPSGTSWSLPLYELALLTAGAAYDAGMERTQITIVTPEPRPLALFGPAASDEVAALLDANGIAFVGSTQAEVRQNDVVLGAGRDPLPVASAVALPRLAGPALPGLPADAEGFIRTDTHGRVAGLDGVWAAGDGTSFPIKQGGLATQQADAVAHDVAARAGAPVTPAPFRPVLRGVLLTGDRKRYLRHAVAGGDGPGEVAEHALWWPPNKVAGRYLAPYLFKREEHELLGVPDEPHVAIELPLASPVAHTAGEPGIEVLGAGRPVGA